MLPPPVEPDILLRNPKFGALYRDLCANKLNADCTTKTELKAQKERDALSDELQKARVAAAKQNLIKTYLQTVAYRGDELPSELQELVGIIAAALHANLSKEDASLLKDDVEKFKSGYNIQLISLVVSHAAAEDITSLAKIASSGHGDSLDWRDIPTKIQETKYNIADSSTRIEGLRLDLIHETTALHGIYRQAIESSIRILEQTIHGSVSRSTKAKAEYLATVAEGMAKKLQLQNQQVSSHTRSPEMQEALRTKTEALEREGLALKRKAREAEERLAEYREARAIEGMAAEYADLLKEIDKVEEDISRLGSRS